MFPLFFFYYSILLCFKILRGNVGEKSRGREREREREMGWRVGDELLYFMIFCKKGNGILSSLAKFFIFFSEKGMRFYAFSRRFFFFFFGIQNNYSPRLQLFFFFFFYHL